MYNSFIFSFKMAILFLYSFNLLFLFNRKKIVDEIINNIDGFGFVLNNEIGFDNVSIEKLVCLANLDLDQDMNQFAFENKLNAVELLA